ncbi:MULTISPECIES: biotin--[acetyl-CoA-carboxylase] ligase [unclassified Sedimentibacter]|uniref:biotin--[acetyl-CoA-carboxylase] ligase n=1 Tax=unclassified Sedimentibacter TaxID=2649220 RepID=UPI0027E0AAE1|nr:biotin--[acetyl-CoA-carboxylase] ligase [Sedimentibacter sp. MB35-C1]WMJ78902.1 biotin--[acetyl-CoA-carboxylase] ligase [Sedimentibacter sp. MB35-C1]
MTVKNEVLNILEQYKGKSISGQELAEKLCVSRTSIWKAINSLKNEGYIITGVSNKGYSLSKTSDILSSEGIRTFLSDEYKNISLTVHKTIGSTNTEAKLMSMKHADHGTVILSEEQTEGRGRMGRSFYSPSESGIYMSIILKPKLNISDSVLITTAAAVAVCLSIDKFTNQYAEIKWVNDVYIGGKKVCGILTEAVTDMESGTVSSIVVGIGLNVQTELFPPELKETAGSIFSSREGHSIRNQLSAEIINNILSICNEIETRSFLKIYKDRSMILGERIRYLKNGKWIEGYAQDIDEHGGLVVFHDDDNKEILHSGEISVRKQQ